MIKASQGETDKDRNEGAADKCIRTKSRRVGDQHSEGVCLREWEQCSSDGLCLLLVCPQLYSFRLSFLLLFSYVLQTSPLLSLVTLFVLLYSTPVCTSLHNLSLLSCLSVLVKEFDINYILCTLSFRISCN